MKIHLNQKRIYLRGILSLIIVLPVLSLYNCSFTGNSNAHLYSHGLSGDLIVHDPVMIKEDNSYYIFHTGKGVSIKSSEDRYHWDHAGSVFSDDALPEWHREDIPEQDGHLWAPDIHYRNGLYHLYYSVSAWMNFNSSIGYATNTTLDRRSPDYRWIDQGKVISFKNGGEGVNVIDPNVFADADGKVWLFYGSFQAGLRAVELDPETGKLQDEEQPELIIITPALGEGVYIIQDSIHYYIFASRGICCKGIESTYQIVIGRSEQITGPYLNKEGKSWLNNDYSLFLAGDEEEPGRGHNGFFTENDTTFIVYHAYTKSADGAPLLNIRPLFVNDEDGWPTLDTIPGSLFERLLPG